MFIYLLTGIILGLVATIYEARGASSAKRKRTLTEMVAITLIATIAVSLVLHVSIVPAVSASVAFAVINQIPKWFYGTIPGQIVRELGTETPLAILGVIATGIAWHVAVMAIAALLASEPIPDLELQKITATLYVITEVTVGFSMYKGDIENDVFLQCARHAASIER